VEETIGEAARIRVLRGLDFLVLSLAPRMLRRNIRGGFSGPRSARVWAHLQAVLQAFIKEAQIWNAQ
jgi:hypothetical protein